MTIPLQRILLAATTIVLVSGGVAQATDVQYDCNGGTRLAAQFTPPGAADSHVTLTFAGSKSTLVLPQMMSADGGRYVNDKVEFWIKGQSATLTRDGKSETCTAR
jgi:membrane-bound inhibitor of C-type lysozyme